MTILTLRTDKPEAELYLYKDSKKLSEIKWQAHRELAETIHSKIEEILNKSSIKLKNLDGIVCYKGPGSFTGLRIGLSVANALAYANNIPVIAAGGKEWIKDGINDLQVGKNDKIAMPEYDSPPNITKPRK